MAAASANLGARLLDDLRRWLDRRGLTYSLEPRRLTRGMFAEVWQFGLANGPEAWRGSLVLRLYPSHADPGQPHIEASVQNGLASQGFPALRVFFIEDEPDALGHRFVVMQWMPGRPALLGVRWDRFLRDLPRLVRSWPSQLAEVAGRLHQCPAGAVRAEAEKRGVAPATIGWERHLRQLEERVTAPSLPGWTDGLGWLRKHLPAEPVTPTVVHGDLWPANLLYEGSELSGLTDWDRTTLGEPALDIGFAKVGWALTPAPALVPPPIYQALRLLGRSMTDRIEREYGAETELDPDRVRYYEALRCALELAAVVEHRSRADAGRGSAGWEHGAGALREHFRAITGVPLETGAR